MAINPTAFCDAARPYIERARRLYEQTAQAHLDGHASLEAELRKRARDQLARGMDIEAYEHARRIETAHRAQQA